MTSEMTNLLTKAQSGDADSQYQLARAYAFGQEGFAQNFSEAVKWFQQVGEEYPEPLYNLIGMCLGACGEGGKNPKGVIDAFTKLVTIHKSPDAMIDLGAIYCGHPNNRHLASLPELSAFYNPSEGFRLIEEGVAKAESGDENPLGHSDYATASNAYHHDTRKRGEEKFFNDFDHLAALAKKVIYTDRALDAMKAGKGTENMPQENIPQMIALYDATLDSNKKELMSMLKSNLHMRNYGNEMMRKIGGLRNTGKVGGISVARKDELADVLEKFLRIALDGIA